MDYKEYYDKMLIEGQEYQDFVADELYKRGISLGTYASKKWQIEHGENRAGVEIKYDMKVSETGNLWIETKEKSHPDRPNYVASGIYRDDNSWLYCIGDYNVIYVMPKTILRIMFEQRKYRELENGSKTSMGFLLPKDKAQMYAAIVITLGDDPWLIEAP